MKKNLIFIIFLLCFYSSIQEISILQRDNLVITFAEIGHLANDNHPILFMAPLIDGKDNCDDFPTIPLILALNNQMFLLIYANKTCSANYQISRARTAGYNALILVTDKWPHVTKNVIHQNDSYFLLVIVSEKQAEILSKISFPSSYIVIYKENVEDPIQRSLPLIGTCVLVVILLFGTICFHLGRYIVRKVMIYRKKNRIYTLPYRNGTDGDVMESCSICLDIYMLGDRISILNCKHEFHQKCLKQWDGENCPLCRSPLYKSQVMGYTSVTNLTQDGLPQEYQDPADSEQSILLPQIRTSDTSKLIEHVDV